MFKVPHLISFMAVIVIAGGIFFSIRAGLVGNSYYRYQCERGYYTYPYGVTDSSSTYYDSNGRTIGECRSWIAGDTCEPSKKAVGQCNKEGVVRWWFY